MRKVLYVLNDCMRQFSYERITGLYRAAQTLDTPVNLYIVRSDGYANFAPEHNRGEYNIFRLPDYNDFDGIILDINSILDEDFDSYTASVLNAVRKAAASGKAVVSMAKDIEGCHYVGIDNYRAMQSTIRHLHESLHLSDFWFAMGPPDNYENQTRTRGLTDYCAENGLDCGPDRFYAESFIIESGMRAFSTLYARHHGKLPQAVICANDYIAIGICHAAEKAGFRIPGDLFVTGFDNIDVSSYLSPSITTVDQMCRNSGLACMDAISRIWAGEEVPRYIYTPTELVLRETTGNAVSSSGDFRTRVTEYINRTSSVTDFGYRLTEMQYQLPACRTIEEICGVLIRCLSTLNCKGASLVLDSDLFENSRLIEFSDRAGQMKDPGFGLMTEGYSDRMIRVLSWEAGRPPRFDRKKVGSSLDLSEYRGPGENHLFLPLHFMENTVGYLAIRDCIDLVRIKGVSSLVNTLTMALRTFFARRNLSYINQVLSGLSVRDSLTGLYNRLGYHELAYPLYQRTADQGGRLAIIFFDMDRLKYINDTYGHAVGDLAIKSVSAAISRIFPEEAVPVRYGGDEFLVLLPARGEEEARRLLDAVQACLPAEAGALGVPDDVGVSSGFVLTDPEHMKPLDEYVLEADERMYSAKTAKKRNG